MVGYENNKRAIIASTTYLGIGEGTEQAQRAVKLQTTASTTGHERKLKANQRAEYLQRNHGGNVAYTSVVSRQ